MRAQGLARPPEAPLATIAKVNGAQQLAALDARGAGAGPQARHGACPMRARMHPALLCADADPPAEAQTLAHIADWCRRFTPLAALDAPDGVMLDVSGAAHLFGGEASLQADIEARLRAQGFCARAALASTPEAAFALARYGGARRDARILPAALDAAALARRLGELPLAALRLDRGDAASARRRPACAASATSSCGRARRSPPAAAPSFMPASTACWASPKRPISPRFEAPAFIAERRFLDGVSRREDIEASILSLAHDLSACWRVMAKARGGSRSACFASMARSRRFEAGASRPLREPGRHRQAVSRTLRGREPRQ